MGGLASKRAQRVGRRGWAGLELGAAVMASAGAHAALADTITDQVRDVVVTARRPTLGLLSETVQNTAQSITVIPQLLIQERGLTSLQQALKTVPGVTLNAGEGGAHGDTVNLRGFAANDDFFLDGLRDTGYYTRDTFDLDALEVYKGPASTLFGRGSTGGVINQVSKTPMMADDYSAVLQGGTNDQIRATGDLDQVIGDGAAFRLNAVIDHESVAGRPFDRNRRWGVAPSLELGMGGPTTLTLTYLHQHEDNTPDPGIPFVGSAPAQVPRDVYYGLPSDDRTQANVDVLTAKLAHDFSSNLSLTETLRYGSYDFVSRITEPHYGATAPAAGTPLSAILIYRDRPSVFGDVQTAMSDTELSYKLNTGPVVQTLVAGMELDQESADDTRLANQLNNIAPVPILDPDPFEAFPGTQTTPTSEPHVTTRTASFLVGDTIDFGSHWTLGGALRHDTFYAEDHEPISGLDLHHTDEIFTPRVSLVYRPVQNVSLYGAYGTSYDPSAENLSLSKSTADLSPEKDRTVEVGAKASVLDDKLALTGAVFRTEMTNARVIDPVSLTTSLQGNLRAQGVEVQVAGHLTKQLEVSFGYTYLDARTTYSLSASQIGQRLPNTARNQANLWTTYEITDRFKLGAGVNYLGERAADASGVAFIPGYVTFDAMASYRFSPHVQMQLNGTNLGDRFYYSNAYYSSAVENHVVPGPGRTVNLALKVSY
jgi:catecholate siderophore receptor